MNLERFLKLMNQLTQNNFNQNFKNVLNQMVQQGSITVDGVSLTVFDLHETTFDIHLIPETRKSTILSDKKWAMQFT